MTRRLAWVCALSLLALVCRQSALGAHVTIRTAGPLPPSGFATITVAVPTERPVPTTRVVLDVPDDFLQAGGRVSRLEFPPNWTVTLDKADMPAEVYEEEAAARQARTAARAPADHGTTHQDPAAEREAAAMDEARRKWIKRVVFDGGSIPVDGFAEFRLSIVVPTRPGRYRFPATQVYEDGKEVKWVELVEGAERPAPTLAVEAPPAVPAMASVSPALSIVALVVAAAALVRRRSPR
jgi:hypothetical protein